MRKIFINNFPHFRQNVKFSNVSKPKELLEIITGYDITMDHHIVVRQIASTILTSLLICDEIVIEASNLIDLKKTFKKDDLFQLLRMKLIRVVPDTNLNPMLKKEKYGFYKADFISYGVANIKNINNPFGFIEEKLLSSEDFSKTEIDRFLLLAHENLIDIKEEEIKKNTIKELEYDLRNQNLSLGIDIKSKIVDKIVIDDVFKILRVIQLNKSLVLASTINAKDFIVDGEVSNLMTYKITPALEAKAHREDSSIFKRILEEKGIPDFGDLYVSNVISLDDILNIRSSIQSKIFNFWIESKNYNETEIKKELLNIMPPGIKSKTIKSISWLTVNILSFISPAIGLPASYAESYILNKMLDGWHPNLFLDNNLKASIDKSIIDKNNKNRDERYKEKFPHLGRNKKCWCGSNKKYKHCHAKNIK